MKRDIGPNGSCDFRDTATRTLQRSRLHAWFLLMASKLAEDHLQSRGGELASTESSAELSGVRHLLSSGMENPGYGQCGYPGTVWSDECDASD